MKKLKENVSKILFGFSMFVFAMGAVQLVIYIHELIEHFDFDDIFTMVPSLSLTFGAGLFFLALYKIIELLENKK